MTAKIKLNAASGGGSVSLEAPTSTTGNANVEFKLPIADGTSGQALTTNASGQLAFATVAVGGASNISFNSGNGIDFSASSNESGSTTELLDDYERGNFNPTWRFDPTNATSVTYNSNEGTYVKVGRLVYFALHLHLSSKGTLPSGAGYAQIEGLPFAVDANGGFGVIAYYDNFGSYNPSVARVTPSEQIYIAQHNSGGYSQDLQHTHMNNSSRMYVGGCYSTTA